LFNPLAGGRFLAACALQRSVPLMLGCGFKARASLSNRPDSVIPAAGQAPLHLIRVKKANQMLEAAGRPPRGHAKPVDQRFLSLYSLQLRLNFDEMPIILFCRVGREHRFRRLQLLM
jgi:hypothetical protein